jgi:hypothetical protein
MVYTGNRPVLVGHPDAAEIKSWLQSRGKKKWNQTFQLDSKRYPTASCWCYNPVKLLAPNFWDFKFIFLVCSGCKGRDQHRERIGAAYLPSK